MSDEFPVLLREHRMRRGWSQERLGFEAGVSPRHLSFLETGKARPSREMVVVLATALDLELRERNALLVSGGYAAMYPATPLEGLSMAPVRRAIDLVLAQQEPYGAVLIDRCWNVLRTNGGAARMLDALLGEACVPERIRTNLARASLHPEGLRPHVVNWHEVASLLLERIVRAHHAHPLDPDRRALLEEVRSYPDVSKLGAVPPSGAAPAAFVHLRRGPLDLKVFALLTTIGTPVDVTAQDLCIESFFPVDDATAQWFRSEDG